MEYLTSQSLREDQLDANAKRLYSKGEEICKKWAMNNEDQRISPTSYDLSNLNDNSDETSNESSISNAYTHLLEEESQEKD